jgi:hypothetical protein
MTTWMSLARVLEWMGCKKFNSLLKTHFMNLLNNKPQAEYSCEQLELYAVGSIGWGSCKTYVADFAAFKPKYTIAFIDGKLTAIAAARALPDEMVRNAMVHTKLMALRDAGSACLAGWQGLKRYINTAFPEPEANETQLQEAGQALYREASKEDWEKVFGLMEAGKNYIDAHLAALTANDNMPATFETDFDDLITTFDTAYNDFKQTEEEMEVKSQEKIVASNAVHRDLAEMFADGQHIFRYDAAKREQFVFENVLSLVSSGGGGGGNDNSLTLSGVISDNVTGNPIGGAQFTVGPHVFTSDANGNFNYTFSIDEPTTYNVTIIKTGYETENTTVQFAPGVDVVQDLQMSPVVPVATGSVTGTVTDSVTALGIGGVLVQSDSGGVMVITNASGNYTLTNLPVGNRTITYSKVGYVSQQIVVNVTEGGTVIMNVALVPVP